MTGATTSKSDRIGELNDAFRRTFVGGAVMITAGVHNRTHHRLSTFGGRERILVTVHSVLANR